MKKQLWALIALAALAMSGCGAPPYQNRDNFRKSEVYQMGPDSVWECRDGQCQQIR